MSRLVEVAPERYAAWRERFDANNPDGPQRVVGVARFDHDPLAVVLVRRGGYAVGVASGDRLTAHKVGTRYVQSRTAAGGWSQQRFARRRANQADGLVGEVMGARGYPVDDFDQQAADVSVDHPRVVEHYRAAHAVSQASADQRASTEDLRQAMVHYRALFDELLGNEHHTTTDVKEAE